LNNYKILKQGFFGTTDFQPSILQTFDKNEKKHIFQKEVNYKPSQK